MLLLLLTGFTITRAQAASSPTTVDFALSTLNANGYPSNAVVTGDFNNDGILDLVTINGTTISFFKGLGGGKFAAPVNQTVAATMGQAFAADFNGDGKLDIATAFQSCCPASSGPVTILLGNGDGTFKQGTSINVSGLASSIALADFNGDHLPDIAVSDGDHGLTWIYVGNGDGTFRLTSTQPFGGYWVVAGDFNADGKQDVAYASGNGGNTVGMFLGNGNGTLESPITATVQDVSSLAVGDFYNNRIQTLAALGGELGTGYTYVYSLQYSNNQVLVQNQDMVGNYDAGVPYDIAAGDLNGDLLFDIFLSGGNYNAGGESFYLLGNGDGTFQPIQNPPSNNDGYNYLQPVIRDLNLDSKHDVTVAWNALSNSGAEVLRNRNATPNCDPPGANALSMNICAPKSGAMIDKTYTFKGAGNAFNGIAKRMELWIDGKKVGQDLEDQLKITATLSAGTHTASFVVVDSFDAYTSKSVTFTTR